MELIIDADHFQKVVLGGICRAKVSIDIMTADFKAMLVPTNPLGGRGPGAVDRRTFLPQSWHRRGNPPVARGRTVRRSAAGTPPRAAAAPDHSPLPRALHSKAVIIDAAWLYLGSANLTGAGLGAKADGRRNFEMGVATQQTEMIDQVMAEFNQLWEGVHCKTCRRRDVCPMPLEEPRL